MFDRITDEFFLGLNSTYKVHEPTAVDAVLNYEIQMETYSKRLPISNDSLRECSIEGYTKSKCNKPVSRNQGQTLAILRPYLYEADIWSCIGKNKY